DPVLTRTLSALPEAIGLIDASAGGIQTDAKLADAVISTLRESGHALLTYDVGLNATDKKARREGVKSATVFRVLDRDRESGIVIKRYLDRAALEAGKTGRIIVIGHSYPETVTALFSWALSAKSRTVALAPASAAILAR
ncbi:MAG: divergent polysaccharide deacetylase family protein, partial [Paracoccaceae bacterium]